jgi:hypothetical protein
MSQRVINVGLIANDGGGDTLRTGAQKINDNFTELYAAVADGQVNADWNATSGTAQILNKPVLFSGSYVDLTNKPTFADVALSGSYFDLDNTPTLSLVATTGNYNDLSNKPVTFSGNYDDLTNKPTLFSGSYNDLTNKPTIPNNTNQLINGAGFITSASLAWANISGKPTFATVATSGSYNDLTNKPTIPAAYTLPTATTSVLGGVKIDGTSITITNGVISSTGVGTVDWSVIQNRPTFSIVATSGLYQDLSGKPTIPTSILNLGISDGLPGTYLTTNGSGSFSFAAVPSTGGSYSRTTASATTSSIANNSTGNIAITGFKSYMVLKVQTSAAAWVRLYSDVASRTADSTRDILTDPAPGSGVLAEFITSGAQTVLVTPAVLGFNSESSPTTSIPVAVTNKSGSTTTITVTLTLLQLEV